VEYLRELNARGFGAQDIKNLEAFAFAASELVAPALTFALLGRLALAALFALHQSPERVQRRELAFHTRAVELSLRHTLCMTVIWHQSDLLLEPYDYQH
jgi:hypothetical protein